MGSKSPFPVYDATAIRACSREVSTWLVSVYYLAAWLVAPK